MGDAGPSAKGSTRTTSSRRNRKFCSCFSQKCGIIFLGSILIFTLIFYIIQAIIIFSNIYFDTIYPVIFVLLLLPLVYAVALHVEYYVRGDSPDSRKKLPESFVYAAITSFSLVLWIFLYVGFMYHDDQVQVG